LNDKKYEWKTLRLVAKQKLHLLAKAQGKLDVLIQLIDNEKKSGNSTTLEKALTLSRDGN
jgi:hypothetical protein